MQLSNEVGTRWSSITMYCKIFYFCILMTLASIRIEASPQDEDNRGELGLPIYINTSTVIPTITKTPLIIYADFIGVEVVKNTGKYIEFIFQRGGAKDYVIGGLVGNKLYKVCKQYLLINKDGRSGVVVNGEKFRLSGVNIFCDVVHGNYENAIKYPHDTVTLMQPVKIGHLPNIFFTPLEKILLSGEITKPNTTSITQCINTFSWYDSVFLSRSYFTYEGSYVDPDGNKVALSRALVTQPPYNTISTKQFAAFEKALGNDGSPIKTILPTFSGENTTVKAARQVLPVIDLFSFIGYPSEFIYFVFYRIVTLLSVLLKR